MKPTTAARRSVIFLLTLVIFGGASAFIQAQSTGWTPLPVSDDPLVRMPGTQPGQVTLEAPTRCLNCHDEYGGGLAEPGTQWMGSMMAQASRDFLFWSCMTVAAQDSVWVLGRPNATDLCLRCHFPQGWLEGRSDPTNATLMTGSDYDGLHCDFCHQMVDPRAVDTHAGVNEGSNWLGYWDETEASSTSSSDAANVTLSADLTILGGIKLYNGDDFFDPGGQPHDSNYTYAGSGQFFIAGERGKRAPFADAAARHEILYSRFHKSKYFCATCHDVSNPALANLAHNGTPPGNGTTILPTEQNAAGFYYHVERTFSEFALSDIGQDGGAPGIGPYAPSVFSTPDPDNWIRTCQDCHMRGIPGQKACQQNDGVIRPGNSTEHPKSPVPMHDMTGGNAWVMAVLASSIPGSPNYDATNDALLNQGPAALTLDMTQGAGNDPAKMILGVNRALANLESAAGITNASYDQATGTLTFRVQNNTPHKLISGFPEGRRMFVNIKLYNGPVLIHEVNPYDASIGTLKGLSPSLSSPPLGPDESYEDEIVYEAHTSSALTGEAETFHFVLATDRYKDNRIPPKGFRIAEASARFVEPRWHGVSDLNYFTAAEYAGGYDEVTLSLPAGGDHVEIDLYYQTTSREYIEFLRDEINGTGSLTLSSPTPFGLPTAYIAQTDTWFTGFKAWGNTLWQLWVHNKGLPGAAPYEMTGVEATIITTPSAAGQIPDDWSITGTPLSIDLLPSGDVSLSWGGSCLLSDQDYEIYEGNLGSFTSHAPLFCSTSGATTLSFMPSGGNQYFLVVPSSTASEGSYGLDWSGVERPQGAAACLPQSVGVCPP
jgi:hypothetical protein